MGIDPAHHEQIFGLFQKLDTRYDVDSTGVGLAIVKKTMEQMGGTIEVDFAVEDGQGATFTFTWPKSGAATNDALLGGEV